MKWLKQISVFFIAVVIILGIVLIAVLTNTFTQQAAIGMLVLSTALTAVSSIATYMQAIEARRQRESAERPEVAVYLHPSSNRLMYCIVQNFGALPARNVRIQFNPSPRLYNNKRLEEISLFAKPIMYLPPNERYWRHMGPSPAVLDANKDPFQITVEYESTSGKSFTETITIDLSVLAEANDPAPAVGDQLAIISQDLKEIVSALKTKFGA